MSTSVDLKRAGAEAVGTFFLVLVGPGAAVVNAYSGGQLGTVGVSLAFGFVVTAMIYALGHISGAHINPAVTLGFWSVRRFPATDLVPYILAQCTGAVAASLVLRSTFGQVGNLGATLPRISTPSAFAVEWLLSFVLMFVIMRAAGDESRETDLTALVVGLTVCFCALVGGPITGASMNPARSLGPALVGDHWQGHWIYWLAPVTGMMVGAQASLLLQTAKRPRTSGVPSAAI
jgi:MIP family channel proteins